MNFLIELLHITNLFLFLVFLVHSPTRRLITFDKLFEIEKKVDSGCIIRIL